MALSLSQCCWCVQSFVRLFVCHGVLNLSDALSLSLCLSRCMISRSACSFRDVECNVFSVVTWPNRVLSLQTPSPSASAHKRRPRRPWGTDKTNHTRNVRTMYTRSLRHRRYCCRCLFVVIVVAVCFISETIVVSSSPAPRILSSMLAILLLLLSLAAFFCYYYYSAWVFVM